MGSATAFRSLIATLFLWGSAALADTRIIDGDTIKINSETIRIMGLDTPEIRLAKCEAEKRRGIVAKTVMSDLLKSGQLTLERYGKDKYRRTLAIVRIDDIDVAKKMIDSGLAVPYSGGKRESWCNDDND